MQDSTLIMHLYVSVERLWFRRPRIFTRQLTTLLIACEH